MAHYLAVERVPNFYEAINIKKTTKGRKLFQNDTRECTLEEIDRFTSQYDSIEKMSYELYSENKVRWANCSLAIIHISGTEAIADKNMIFSKNKKYLENPNLVIDYIFNQYKNKNIHFFKEILLILQESDKKIVETLTTNLERSMVYDFLQDNSIALEVSKTLIYKETELDYKKLHDIVLFITDYENKLNKKAENTRKRTKNT